MNDFRELPKELFEMLEAVEARKGKVHAKMVAAVFSTENLFTSLLVLSDADETFKGMARISGEYLIGQFLYCYTVATMKQDPKWSEMEEAEQDDKAMRFLKVIQDDVEMLDRKKKQYSPGESK